MERARHKMEEVIRKHKRLQEKSQASTGSGSANNKSQYILALGGVAAGITIAVIVWLADSILTTNHFNMSAPERAEAVYTGELRKPLDNIARLNERVELLTESISGLEAKLTRIMVLTDSLTDIGKQQPVPSRQDIPESADTGPVSDMNKSAASSAVHIAPETEKAFAPTHTVKTRVNLRPSASLKTKPIAVLKAGTEVEYLGKTDGWYYVRTQFHGKGWCASDYLSALSPARKNPSAD
jgi:uncharacterized protein YgiM (DUF1202 family)